MQKGIKKIWVAGFFLPAINATVFRTSAKNVVRLFQGHCPSVLWLG